MSKKNNERHLTPAEIRNYRKRAKRDRKNERQQNANAIVERAFSSFKTPEEQFKHGAGLRYELKNVILRRAKKLIDPQYQEALSFLNDSENWVRDLQTWEPKGKSGRSLFRSLAKHLFVKYSMPEFMYSVFFYTQDERIQRKGVALFKELGAGGSLYRAVTEGRFRVPLTKRMCHVFLQSTVKFSFVEAIRHAQVIVLGGDRRLAKAISNTRQLGRELGRDGEEFWATVLQWLCNQPMLDPSQAAPILDWAEAQRRANPNFSMKGRTGTSVAKALEEWHTQLARASKIAQHVYQPSGLDAWFDERKTKLPNGASHMERLSITEILSSKELAAEGRALHHCVYSYSWSVQRGNVSIWSYRVDGDRVLTVEVDNRTKRVVQCRGVKNRMPTKSEMAFVEKWMRKNDLGKGAWLPVA